MAKSPKKKKKKKGTARRVFDRLTGKGDDEEEEVAEEAVVVVPEAPLSEVPEVPADLGDPELAPEPTPSKPSADPEGAPPARKVRERYETDSHIIYVIKPECYEEVGHKKIIIKK